MGFKEITSMENYKVICERHNLKVGYSSFKRFVKANHICLPSPLKATCRIEVPPASETQIDYGRMGLLFDPITRSNRVVHAFIATLSYSRHKYVEFVYSQNQQSFIASHVNMFEFFAGVTERINLDNLKDAIRKPDLYDPKLNRAYQEMAEHYHFFIDPCRIAHAKDKGKVERDVQTVREQFRKFLALYPDLHIQQANQLIKKWCMEDYGQPARPQAGGSMALPALNLIPHFLRLKNQNLNHCQQNLLKSPHGSKPLCIRISIFNSIKRLNTII